MSEEKTTAELFQEYHQKISEFLKFDELNLKDSQLQLASVRHYWVGRMMYHRQQVIKFKKAKEKAIRTIKQKLENDSPVTLNAKTVINATNSNEIILKIDEEILNHEFLIDYLTKVEANLRDAQYGLNNLTKIITLETT